MPSVEFIKLERPERAVLLCELAEEFSRKDQRIVIVVQDDNQGVTLDRFMWTWRKGSFVPHVYDNGAIDCIDEPVVITTREENRNGAQVLIQGRPCSIDFVRQFAQGIDFADVYDDQLAQQSRERYKTCRESGINVSLR